MKELDGSKEPDIMRRSRGDSSVDGELNEDHALQFREFTAEKVETKSYCARWFSCFPCFKEPEEEPLVTSTAPVPKK